MSGYAMGFLGLDGSPHSFTGTVPPIDLLGVVVVVCSSSGIRVVQCVECR